MKGIKRVLFIVFAALLAAGFAIASENEASLEKGKALFNDSRLGTTGKSCNDCHPNGKGIEKAGAKKDLENIVNGCITQVLKGTALDVKSMEMQSMVLYIKSFGDKKSQAKKAPVGC